MRLMQIIKSLDVSTMGLRVITEEERHIIQSLLIKMMCDIEDVCKENNISWSLSGGSVLGAVRHKGFIPWDEDIDIFMMREEFQKFCNALPNWFKEKYELKIPGDKGYISHYPRIFLKGTSLRTIQSTGSAQGLYIDIFILENTYNNKLLRLIHGIQCTIYLFISSSVRINACKQNLLKYGNDSRKLQSAVKKRIFFSYFFSFHSYEEWMKRSDKCFSKVSNNNSYYVVAPSGAKHYFGEIYLREKMIKKKEIQFETQNWFIPEDSDYYLSKRYGNDYMVIPPKEKQEEQIYIEIDFGKYKPYKENRNNNV